MTDSKTDLELFKKIMIEQQNYEKELKNKTHKNLYSNLIVMMGLPFTMQIRMVGEILSNQRDIDNLLKMSEGVRTSYNHKEHSIFVKNINGTLFVSPGNGKQLDYDIKIDNIHNHENLHHMAEFFSNGLVGLAIRRVASLESIEDYMVYESKSNYSKFYGYRTEDRIIFTSDKP